MSLFINPPKKIYAAMRQCFTDYTPANHGAARRYAEHIRLGITAYDFTLAWSNQFWLIHVAWPKPNDAGNELEGWHMYLTKYNYALLEHGISTIQLENVVSEPEPFRNDVLADTSVSGMFSTLRTDAKAKGATVQGRKSINAKYLRDVSKLFAAAGVNDMCIDVDFGMGPCDAVTLIGRADAAHLHALIMPIRR